MNPRGVVPYGLREGRLVFAGEVPHGKSCGCVCPACHGPLIARNVPSPTRQRIYHFQHATVTPECGGGQEGAVHRMAKELLTQIPELLLPAFSSGDYLVPAERIQLEACQLEHGYVDGAIRVDAVVTGVAGDELEPTVFDPLLVEIRVRHAVDHEKRGRVRQAHLSMIEIDLSGMDEADLFDREAFIEQLASTPGNRQWINLANAGWLAARARDVLIEVPRQAANRRTLTSAKGNPFDITEQATLLWREGEGKRLVIQLPDTRDGRPQPGYEPGIYTLNPKSCTVDRYQHLRIGYQIYLDRIEQDPAAGEGPQQRDLLESPFVFEEDGYRRRTRTWE